MATTKDLAAILSALNKEKYSAIIERAGLNGYHDHKFDKIPGHSEYGECICPKLKLVEDLSAFPELNNIREEVIGGKYDEPADLEDQQEKRGWLIDDNSPDALFEQLGLKVPTMQERSDWKNKKNLN